MAHFVGDALQVLSVQRSGLILVGWHRGGILPAACLRCKDRYGRDQHYKQS